MVKKPGLRPVPPFHEMLSNAQAMLINQHPLAEFPRNPHAKIRFIGGRKVEQANIIGADKFKKPATLKYFKNVRFLFEIIKILFSLFITLEIKSK